MNEIEMTPERFVSLIEAHQNEDEFQYAFDDLRCVILSEPIGAILIRNHEGAPIMFMTSKQYESFCDNAEEIKQRLGEKSSGSNQSEEE